jgi:hypothetical protein
MFLHFQTNQKLAKLVFILLFSSLFLACTPTLNWREVRFESADGNALKVALPCKSDTATRKQKLSDVQVELSMMGCVVGGATYTLSRIPLTNPLDAPKILTAWQAAAVTNVGVKQVADKPVDMVSAKVSGAGTWPPAVRVTLNGTAIQAHMLWFAKQTDAGLTLYQAAVYDKQPSSEATTDVVATFFESLELQ